MTKYGVLSLGILMLCYVAYLALEQNSIRDWPIAAGIIKESNWQSVGEGHYVMNVKYKYTVDGIQYSSSTISPSYGDGHFFSVNLESRLKRNHEVDVRYSPKDHAKSYLKGFINYHAMIWIGSFGGFVTIMGALIALGILKSAPMKRRM